MLRQAVEVGQHLRAVAVELVVELPPTSQLAEEQAQPPPHQEPLVIDHQRQEPRIVNLVDPGVQFGEEMAHGPGQDRADVQCRPRRRFWSLDVALDQGQGQLADLVDQGLEALVFLHPCLDLLEEVLGHVDGACLALLLGSRGDGLGATGRHDGRRRRAGHSVCSPATGWPPAQGQPGRVASSDCPASGGSASGGSGYASEGPRDFR